MRVYFKYNKNDNTTSLYGDEEALGLFQVESIENNDDEVLLNIVVSIGEGKLPPPPTIEQEEIEEL